MDCQEEEFIPDYEEDIEAVDRIPCSTRGSKRGRVCFICSGRFTHARRHVVRTHLPWFCYPDSACWQCEIQFGQLKFLQNHEDNYHGGTDENRGYNCDNWATLMRALLAELGRRNIGRDSLDGLLEWSKECGILKDCSASLFQGGDMRLLQAFNRVCGSGTNTPVSCGQLGEGIQGLLHWRVLSTAIHMTTGSEELVDFKMGRATKDSVELVDSHFHLDMWCRRSHELRLGEEGPNSATRLVLAIANYCYPRNWPTGSARGIRMDTRVRFSFGIHPRLAALESDQTLRKWGWELEKIIDAQGTVAVGECGLDTSGRTSQRVRERQRMIFGNQVRLAARKVLPIVIHCRGGMRTSEECLTILGEYLRETHRVHRHCFNGDLAEHRMWSQAFPNCKFGISPLILRDQALRSVVRQLPLEDPLIESDAPYLPVERGGVGSPFQVEAVVEAIAEDRAISIRSVAEATTRNARELYHIE